MFKKKDQDNKPNVEKKMKRPKKVAMMRKIFYLE